MFFWVALIVFVHLMTPKAYADCQPIYGGGTTCQPSNIVVTKTVLNPQTNLYVHDLGVNDPQFRPGDMVAFQITVTNNGTSTIGPVTVKDTLPSLLTFGQGVGSFDPNTHTFTSIVGTVNAGQSQQVIVTTHVVDANSLPSNFDSQCLTNQVTATTDDGGFSQDSAQFCLFHPTTAPATPITTPTPSTGPESLPLALLAASGAVGWYVQKHSVRKESN